MTRSYPEPVYSSPAEPVRPLTSGRITICMMVTLSLGLALVFAGQPLGHLLVAASAIAGCVNVALKRLAA